MRGYEDHPILLTKLHKAQKTLPGMGYEDHSIPLSKLHKDQKTRPKRRCEDCLTVP